MIRDHSAIGPYKATRVARPVFIQPTAYKVRRPLTGLLLAMAGAALLGAGFVAAVLVLL